MVNPITAFIKSGMDQAADAEARFEDRVAETSINAQKIVDESHGPYHPHQFWREERRTRDFDHFMVAHSSVKGSEAGYRSSIKAMRYYMDEAEAKRDALLEKYDKKQLYDNEKKYGVKEEEAKS